MKTVIYRQYGEPADVLSFEDVAAPTQPGPDEVIVRVTKRMVHPIDALLIRGIIPMPIPPHGASPGADGVGIVEQIGTNINPASGLVPGTRVALFPPVHGTWVERIVAPATSAIPIPAEVPDEVACQIIINGITSVMLLRAARAGNPAPTILLTAAASGVGRNLLAFCQDKKINVIAAVRSEESAATLTQNFEGLAVVNTEDPDWKTAVKAAYGTAPTAIIDPIGGALASELIDLLADGGTLLSYGGLDHRPSTFSSTAITSRQLNIRGINSWSWTLECSVAQKAADIDELFALAKAFPQNFASHQSFRLEDTLQALAAAQATPRRGAILLTSGT